MPRSDKLSKEHVHCLACTSQRANLIYGLLSYLNEELRERTDSHHQEKIKTLYIPCHNFTSSWIFAAFPTILFRKFPFTEAVTIVVSVSIRWESCNRGCASGTCSENKLRRECNCPPHFLQILFQAKGPEPFLLNAGAVPSASLPVTALHAALLSSQGQVR